MVVGEGPEERRLRRLLPDAVFTGHRTGHELSELLASLDVFVHTGADETFSQAVLEALVSGVPVVAPAAGGPLDLVRPGHNGLLFAPEDGAGLRAAVTALVTDETLRGRLAAHALPSVRVRTWEWVGDELIRHYEETVHGVSARWAA